MSRIAHRAHAWVVVASLPFIYYQCAVQLYDVRVFIVVIEAVARAVKTNNDFFLAHEMNA